MNDVDFLLERVKELVEEYNNDEKIQKEFCEEVEKLYFSNGRTEDKDIASWRKKMPALRKDNVKLFSEEDVGCEHEIVIDVTGTDDERLNRLYSRVITSKMARDLFYTPEILLMDPLEIDNGDGDERYIYFWFEKE